MQIRPSLAPTKARTDRRATMSGKIALLLAFVPLAGVGMASAFC
jgi:hypothetical protein